MIVGLIGTTISPYMQFYLQSAHVEKGTRESELPLARIDVINGSILGIIVAAFMIIANAATIYVFNEAHPKHPIVVNQAADVARALAAPRREVRGSAVCLRHPQRRIVHRHGSPAVDGISDLRSVRIRGLGRRQFSEAPVFFSLFAGGLIVGAAMVMIPGIPLLKLAFYSQVLQGVLLPIELVLMLVIVNRERIMGKYRNTRAANIVCWTTVVIVGVLAIVYTIQQIMGAGS